MLKTGKNGVVYTVGYDGQARGPEYSDEGSTVYGALDPKTEEVRELMNEQAKLARAAKEKQLNEIVRQKIAEEVRKRAAQLAVEKGLKLRAEAIQRAKDLARVQASKQRTLGYDFGSSIGDPLAGFGCDCEVVTGMGLVGELSKSSVSAAPEFSNTALGGAPWDAGGVSCGKRGSYENPYIAEGDDVAELIQDADFDADLADQIDESDDEEADDTADMETPARFTHPLANFKASTRGASVAPEASKPAPSNNLSHPLAAVMRAIRRGGRF
jgi:hypothetical protein